MAQDYLSTLQQRVATAASDQYNAGGELDNQWGISPTTHLRPAEGTSFQSEIAKYNAQDPNVDPYWANKFLGMNDYFKEGQMSPGSKWINTPDAADRLYSSFETQMAKDSAPGFLDKLMATSPFLMVAAITAGVGIPGLAAGGTFESALSQAGIGAAKSAAVQLALNGKIDARSVIAGGAGGFAGAYAPVIKGSPIASAAIKGAVKGGVRSAVGGGDIGIGIVGGAVDAAASAGSNVLFPKSKTAAGGFGGAVSGAVNAVLTGQDVTKGMLFGGATGTLSGALEEYGGLGPNTSGIIASTITSGLSNTDQSGAVPANQPVAPPPAGETPAAPVAGVGGFASTIQPWIDTSKLRTAPDYENRLNFTGE